MSEDSWRILNLDLQFPLCSECRLLLRWAVWRPWPSSPQYPTSSVGCESSGHEEAVTSLYSTTTTTTMPYLIVRESYLNNRQIYYGYITVNVILWTNYRARISTICRHHLCYSHNLLVFQLSGGRAAPQRGQDRHWEVFVSFRSEGWKK